MDSKIKVTGLWEKRTKGGETFYSGNLGPNARLLIFKNNFKQGERDPDLVLYIAQADREGPGGQARGQTQEEISF